jgi:MoxR-like ATPase
LGEAFNQADCPVVVLIDEIDKADIDFPNDLLAVLDEPWEFAIPETGEKPIKAKHIPIVIVTSNKEKGNLPVPFLRRCLYHYIEFPDPERLQRIVDAHYQERPSVKQPPAKLAADAAQQFLALRQEGLFKKPGTSEFLDWLEALHNFKLDHIKLPTLAKENALPFPEILFKLQRDWKLMRDRGGMTAA